jgi:ABC-type branched-subunit amino acid transport system permease subunit
VGAGNANPIYFLLATIAFGELMSRLAIALRPVTGGSTGLAGIPEPDLGLGFRMTSGRYYYLVFVVVAVCVYVMYRIVNSHYGYALRGIHDNEKRMQALGYNTWLYKYTAWIIAGVFGAVAGMLFAHFGGTMVPNSLSMVTSDIAFLLVILGSTTTFFGPLVAAWLCRGWSTWPASICPTGGRSSWAPCSSSRSWSYPKVWVCPFSSTGGGSFVALLETRDLSVHFGGLAAASGTSRSASSRGSGWC